MPPLTPGESALLEKFLNLILHKQWMIAVAESCTGGLLGSWLSHNSGSSAFFKGGVIAYHNDIKEKILGVSASDLTHHGAVSEPIAAQMAQGVQKLLNVQAAISITGVAGPTGGSVAKPVGTIWCGFVLPEFSATIKYSLKGSRESIRQQICFLVLQQMCDYLMQHQP